MFEQLWTAADAAKSFQSCLTLCNPIDGRPPGSSVPGILQVRTLAWVAISFFNAWKWKMKVELLSSVRLLVTTWTAAYQAPPSMGFSMQEYQRGLPLPSPNYELTDMIPDRTVRRFYFLWWKMFSYVKCWGWGGWMASLTQWTSIWVNTGSCW